MKIYALRVLVALLLAGVAACSRASTNAPLRHPGTLVIADGQGDLHTLNPDLYTEANLGWLSELTMAYLTRYDEHNKPYPELETVIPTKANGGISPDGKTITWHLRKGVRWSDGAPFNADDVVFSTKVVLNPANDIVGRDGWDLITKIDEPNEYTVVYHLSMPYASFVNTFFGSGGANPVILPKHLLGKLPNINHATYNSLPVGIGPYRYTAWHRGDDVELEANPYYWRGKPHIAHIVWKIVPSVDTLVTLMQTGDVELWPAIQPTYIDQMKAIAFLTTYVQTSYYYEHVDFNLTNAALADPVVRRALRLAIDRKAIVDKVNHGYGKLQESVISQAAPFYHPVPFVAYDPAKARKLLDADGWTLGPDGIREKNGRKLVFRFAYYTGHADVDAIVLLLRDYWQRIGVAIEPHKYAVDLFFAPYQSGGIVYSGKKWDITIFAWGGDPIGDLSTLYSCSQIPPNGQNILHYCNKAVSEAMAEFKLEYDPAKRQRYLNFETEQLAKDVPTVVLFDNQYGWAYTKHLTGFVPNDLSAFDDAINWRLK